MFVRATTTTADPTRTAEGIAQLREDVVPVVDALPGSLGLSAFCDPESGLLTVCTAWESAAARDAADAALRSARGPALQAMGAGPPVTEHFVLAVLDRARPTEVGFWVRMVRVTVDPRHVDEAIDAYTSSTLHDVQLLPGYCSAVLLVDRPRSAGVVSLTFDGRASLEASRDQAEQIRRTALAKTGAQVDEVREAEVVIAGMRLPQSG